MPADIILSEGDLIFENGDLLIDESTLQHQSLLLLSDKGEFKESPMRCVGAYRYLETESGQSLAREIGTEFSRDGMRVKKVNIDIPNVEVEARYE